MRSDGKRRVLLVDDHPLTRKGLADAIGNEPDLRICGEAEGWREALGLSETLRPDLIVLDLNLKDGSGWEVLNGLQHQSRNLPVLVLSVCDEELYAVRLLRAGAQGYLMKDAPIGKVLEAIRKVLDGHVAVSDTVASSLIHAATKGSVGLPPQRVELDVLSDRELQVLAMLQRGYGNVEVGQALGISQKTVGTYKARMMEKMGVRTTPELLAKVQGKPLSDET